MPSTPRPHTPDRLEASDKDLVQSYLDDVALLPVLEPEEQIRLFQAMESAEQDLRLQLSRIPAAARVLVGRWVERKNRGLVTGALSRGHRDGSGRDLNAAIDALKAHAAAPHMKAYAEKNKDLLADRKIHVMSDA